MMSMMSIHLKTTLQKKHVTMVTLWSGSISHTLQFTKKIQKKYIYAIKCPHECPVPGEFCQSNWKDLESGIEAKPLRCIDIYIYTYDIHWYYSILYYSNLNYILQYNMSILYTLYCVMLYYYIILYYIMVTDRIMEKKKTFNLDRRRLRPIFP